jgi:hypothetical protein
MDLESFLASDYIVLEGHLLKREGEGENVRVFVQLFPGLVVHFKATDIHEIDEATDPLTNLTLLRVTLQRNATISTEFEPQLVRLAFTRKGLGVPPNLESLVSPIWLPVQRFQEPSNPPR